MRLRPAAVDDDAFREAVEVVIVGHAQDFDLIFAFDLVARVREARGEIAVAGQEQQTF